jgi:LCP family protein required for cell wall assembly
MSQASPIPPPGRPPRTPRRRPARRRAAAAKAAGTTLTPLQASSATGTSATGSSPRWKRTRARALAFVIGAGLGYGLVAPARSLGHLLAGLAQGPRAVGAMLAAPHQSHEPILVLGSDQVSGSTDVIFTVRVADGLTRVTQVPRDTFVETPDLGVQKVNALYAVSGIDATRDQVGRLVGTPVQKYLKVNLRAVERVADALGGVEVDVPKRMAYADYSQGLFIDLYPGRQTLKGKDLEGFLRFRHDEEGDLGRMDRQRLVINEVFRKLVRPATLVQLPALLKIAGEDVDTNLSPIDMSRVIGLMGNSKLSSSRLPGRMYWQDDLSYWMPDSNREHPTGSGDEPVY